METKYLIFSRAKNIQHDVFGECRMEVWCVYRSGEQNKLGEPEYHVEYFKNGQLIDSSY